MDVGKTGALIRQLRVSKGMTQREIAQKLMVSEQAVSKWERGLGCPDISLLRELAGLLRVDVRSLLTGELNESERDGGNMRRIRFYVCPVCGNVVTMTGEAQVSCCGRTLEAMKPVPCCAAACTLQGKEEHKRKPSPSSLRDATSPEGRGFMHLSAEVIKAPPFGGAGAA